MRSTDFRRWENSLPLGEGGRNRNSGRMRGGRGYDEVQSLASLLEGGGCPFGQPEGVAHDGCGVFRHSGQFDKTHRVPSTPVTACAVPPSPAGEGFSLYNQLPAKRCLPACRGSLFSQSIQLVTPRDSTHPQSWLAPRQPPLRGSKVVRSSSHTINKGTPPGNWPGGVLSREVYVLKYRKEIISLTSPYG